MLRLITFNVRSLRRPEALDLIINFMRTHGIHCAALQETWLPGSLVEQNKGFTIIRHNADGKAGERGGVAILLDPLATEAWGRAGNATELFSRRCIGVKLRFTTKDSTQNTVCFISAYAPTSGHTDAECDAFHDTMADAVAWAAPTDILALSGSTRGGTKSLRGLAVRSTARCTRCVAQRKRHGRTVRRRAALPISHVRELLRETRALRSLRPRRRRRRQLRATVRGGCRQVPHRQHQRPMRQTPTTGLPYLRQTPHQTRGLRRRRQQWRVARARVGRCGRRHR